MTTLADTMPKTFSDTIIRYAIEVLGLTEVDIRDFSPLRDRDVYVIRQWNRQKHRVAGLDLWAWVTRFKCGSEHVVHYTMFEGYDVDLDGGPRFSKHHIPVRCDLPRGHGGAHETDFRFIGMHRAQRLAWPRS